MNHGPLVPLAALLAAGFLPHALNAQQPPPPETAVGRVEPATGLNLSIPQPPRVVLSEVPMGRMPEVPIAESGLPQPQSPAMVIGDLTRQPLAGQFTFFRNRDQRPSGITSLNPGEPSTAVNRDTWFATGNTYGSLSRDSGMTWTHVNPTTLFPAADGGVCCDQRVLFDQGSGLTLWYIQYRYSATTNTGGFRLAWARTRDQLRASTWSSVYYNGNSFGLPGNWLDFPDIAISDQHVYIATNTFNASSVYQNSLIIRIPLSNLSSGGTIVASYYRRSGGSGPMGGGASYRFTQSYNGTPPARMFWASHNSTSSLRIFAWDDAGTARLSDVDRSIPSWTSGAGSSPGPDGRNWIGFDDHRIASGYHNHVFNEAAFLWTSNANGGSRPQSYVRVQVFSPGDRSIIGTEDVWNGTIDFAYPAVGLNSLGHGGVVMSGGSSTINVTTWAFVVDNYFSFFAGNTIFAMATGSNGAPSNRWGDYHSVVANPIDPRTFIGTGQVMSGGTSSANIVHRTAWFGRDDYTPAWVTLNVASSPVSGVSITVDETDRNGNKNGTTPFSRSYTPQQGYTLRAPATVASGSNTYLFTSWTGTGGSSSNTAYTVSSIGSSTHSATANYALQATITVDDRNVAAGVAITAGRTDLDGLGNGTTRFSRRYRATDGPFSFTAPALAGNQPFRRWYVGGVAQATGQRTVSISPTASAILVEAEYCSYTQGSITAFGTGCAGSNSQVPLLASTSSPDIGTTITQNVSRVFGATSGILALGLSNTSWNGVPLPFSLGVIGGNPACRLLAEPLITLPVAINGSGNGSVSFPIPNEPSGIGQRMFTQLLAVDPFVGFRVPLVVSNGLDMRLGGSSLGGGPCP